MMRLFSMWSLLAISSMSMNAAEPGGPAFPLKISDNHRYLVDQRGQPFLIHGDSPWEIIWQATREEATEYLDRRVAQGFNTVLVNLIPDKLGDNDHPWTKNRYGARVFRDPNDFTTAVPEYFGHAEWFVGEAGKRGLLVLLFPCYLGIDTTWIDELHANGVDKARAYGRFVAERFAKHPNIIWIMGGDRDPGYALAEHDALAEAIHEHDPQHLMTFHGREHSSATLYHHASWLGLNLTYNYRETYVQSHEDYRRTPVKPTFLGESGYEREANDHRYGTPQRMRRQAYWTLLAGSCGHVYGTAFWHLRPGWRDSLDWTGARQMKYVRDFFESLPWHQLVPEFEKQLILAGQGEYGSKEDYVTAAATADRKTTVLYMPIARRVRLNLALFPAPVRARWFDPTTGAYIEMGRESLPNRGDRWLTPPPRDCDSDWVLLLQASSIPL